MPAAARVANPQSMEFALGLFPWELGHEASEHLEDYPRTGRRVATLSKGVQRTERLEVAGETHVNKREVSTSRISTKPGTGMCLMASAHFLCSDHTHQAERISGNTLGKNTPHLSNVPVFV